jgi:hypothetical protein
MKEAPRLAEWRFEFVWLMALRLYYAIKPFVSTVGLPLQVQDKPVHAERRRIS